MKQFLLSEIKKSDLPGLQLSDMTYLLPGVKARHLTVSDIASYIYELVDEGRLKVEKNRTGTYFSLV